MRLLLVLAVVFAAVLLASPAGAAASTKPTKCTPPKTFPEAGGKFTSLTALGTTCKTATSLATAVAKCQAANGKGGRCVKKVSGYACTEQATTVGTVRTSKLRCVKKAVVVTFGETRQV
jgi:hypothetical protein